MLAHQVPVPSTWTEPDGDPTCLDEATCEARRQEHSVRHLFLSEGVKVEAGKETGSLLTDFLQQQSCRENKEKHEAERKTSMKHQNQ